MPKKLKKKPMAKSTPKKPPVRKKTGGASFVKIRKYKNHTTLTFHSRLFRTKKVRIKVKKHPQLASNIVTFLLLIVSVVGISLVTRPYVYALTVSTDRYSQDIVKPQSVQPPKKVVRQDTGLPFSEPVQLSIPAINLAAGLVRTGINADNGLSVPEAPDTAGWYQYSPSPGQVGPAIIAGHVETANGPAVFTGINALQTSDIIQVMRADGKVVTYKVDELVEYSQDNFPSDIVYANTNKVSLRLITCSGVYNFITGHYTTNLVVYASKA